MSMTTPTPHNPDAQAVFEAKQAFDATKQEQAPLRATAEEWSEAWIMFNGGLKRLNELARKDGITITLGRIPTIGLAKRRTAK